jgi:hypothetical protein
MRQSRYSSLCGSIALRLRLAQLLSQID